MLTRNFPSVIAAKKLALRRLNYYRLMMSSPMNLPPLPDPVAYGLQKPDGTIDTELVGSREDCVYWSRADGYEPQSGLPVAGIYTADQMHAYGDACAAAEREAWNDAISDALQSDLENGVKWLNEHAARDFEAKYPALAAVIRARGESK